MSEWNTGWRRNPWVTCRGWHVGVERWQMMAQGKMSEWDTGERSESVFFRWSMLQDNVVSFVALEHTASKFVQDNSMYPLFFLRQVVVGPATLMLAPTSSVFFFKIWCISRRSCRGAGSSLIEFGWIGDKVNPHPFPLSFFFFEKLSHQCKCSGTSSISHIRIGL